MKKKTIQISEELWLRLKKRVDEIKEENLYNEIGTKIPATMNTVLAELFAENESLSESLNDMVHETRRFCRHCATPEELEYLNDMAQEEAERRYFDDLYEQGY